MTLLVVYILRGSSFNDQIQGGRRHNLRKSPLCTLLLKLECKKRLHDHARGHSIKIQRQFPAALVHYFAICSDLHPNRTKTLVSIASRRRAGKLHPLVHSPGTARYYLVRLSQHKSSATTALVSSSCLVLYVYRKP